MIKVDFRKDFQNLQGEVVPGVVLADTLADSLSKVAGNLKPRVAIGWAKALVRGEPLIFQDEETFQGLFQYIETRESFTPLYIDQLLTVMDEAKQAGVV